jgi:hypothetical protein
VKLNEELKENTAELPLKQKSSPQGNVQRSPSNPQEKRRSGTGEETKTPNSKKENKGNKRKKWPRRNKL